MNFLHDLAKYLETKNVGVIGSDLFIGWMGADPDNIISIFPTGGIPDSFIQPLKNYTVQITNRNLNFEDGLQKTQEIRDILHLVYDYEVLNAEGNTDILIIRATQEPTHLGEDENGRHIFTINFILVIR